MSTLPKFHHLKIIDRRLETRDSVSIAFAVPPELKAAYAFTQGQYLTLKAFVNGQELRRSYSICSAVSDYENNGELRVAIKRVDDGQFSNFAFNELRANASIDVMMPQGRFFSPLNSENAKHYVAFASGSGITPIASIMRTTLEAEPNSQFTLVYGNRNAQNIMLLESIEAIKNEFMTRVKLIHILSRQPQEAEIFNGRINRTKVAQLLENLVPAATIDQCFICGPESMIEDVEAALISGGVEAGRLHSERFGTPVHQPRSAIQTSQNAKALETTATGKVAQLSVVLDGKSYPMNFAFDGEALLDVALSQGLDLPFACKGGVCCTCRAKVMSGQVRMDKNYTLEQWEIDKGFVLTCQCHPITDEVVVSFDER